MGVTGKGGKPESQKAREPEDWKMRG